MLLKKLIAIRRADAELPPEIRAALVKSLFAPISSLTVGAINCSIIGMVVALSVGNDAIMANSVAIFAVGMLRVVSAILYRRYRAADQTSLTKTWERVYEAGAWAFSALLGVLCWLTLTETRDPALQMAVITTATGYAAAISGRNAGRPFIALGQFTSIMLPMVVALFLYPDWIHKILGFVGLLFMYGMMDITLGIREVIIQALTMTRKEAALAARFEEQANRFDIALNNMSHGLCMLDQQDRLQVWNRRFLDLLHLKKAPVRVGMKLPELLRHSIRAGNYKGKKPKQVFSQLVHGLRAAGEQQLQISPDGEKTIALSRRMMADGGSVVILEDITERKRAQERISYLARYDDLTGLANRVQFNEELSALLVAVRRGESDVTLQLIDLDRFKTINDTLGHPVGDKLLKQVAERLRAIIRPSDLITRFGGDEFIVVQTGTDNRQNAEWLAQRLLRAIAEPFEVDGHRLDIGASIGIAMAPADGTDADQLLKKADMALYAAKHSGRGGHQFFAAEMEEAVQVRRLLEIDMREALAANQFTLEFQPLIDLHTGRITTCEALVRWSHPKRGAIPPSVFIPVAEETGMIIALGQKILDMACMEAADLAEQCQGGGEPFTGAVQGCESGAAYRLRLGKIRPAGAAARARSDRTAIAGGIGRDARGDQAFRGTRRQPVARRFRHRLLVAQLPAQIPVPQDQDRPVLHSQSGSRSRRARDRRGGCESRRQPRQDRGCRRHRNRKRIGHGQVARLPSGTGLFLQRAADRQGDFRQAQGRDAEGAARRLSYCVSS